MSKEFDYKQRITDIPADEWELKWKKAFENKIEKIETEDDAEKVVDEIDEELNDTNTYSE